MKTWITLLACSAAVLPMNAYAQSADSDEIIVTAQKRSENLQDVPISMEVLQADTLEDFNTDSLEGVTTLVPNFFFQPSPGNDALYIRGFGSSGANFGFEQSVSLYQDGVYAGRARQFMAPFFDVERVEVLRGPQGALLGKNTAAGAVSIVTARPTREFEANLTALYNFDREGTNLSGVISGPLGETVSARLAVTTTDFDGYWLNTETGNKAPALNNTLARLSVAWEPSANFNAIARLEYANFETEGDTGTSSAPSAPLPPNKADSNIFGFPLVDEQEGFNGSVTANWEIGDYLLTSITGYTDLSSYRAVDAPHEANARFHNQYYEDFDQFSQEIRLISPEGRFIEFIVGAYYDLSHWDALAPTYYNIIPLSAAGRLDVDFQQRSETWSVFGGATFNISDQFRIKPSLRYTDTQKEGDFVETLVYGNTHPAIGGPRAFSAPLALEIWDPAITFEYDVTPDLMVFANYANGSKGPGYVSAARTTVPSTFTFLEERSTNYELGVRSTWFDRRLTANLTLFRTEFEDLQVSAYSVAAAAPITTNAASARSEGVEGTITWAVSDSLDISSSFAYTNAEYTDYPGAACTALQPAPPCTAATNNIGGYPLLSTPEWSGSVRADYETPLTENLVLDASLVATFKTDYYVATDYNPVYGEQEGWTKFDLRVGVSDANDRWSLALIGTNLTDETTSPFVFPFPGIFTASGTGRIVRYVDEPRTVSIQASLNF